MSSNLKVNSLVPATGTEIGIGTTGGSIDFRCPATFGGNVTIGGTLTYDEVINIDSIGIITARSNIDCNGDLDVDGHTDLDNVSIAGFTTFAQSINVLGSMTGQSVVLNAGSPTIFLNDTDTNSDFSIQCNGGLLKFMDTTNSYALRLSINSSGNVAIAQDLDVDGHTDLDNVSIAGITTFYSPGVGWHEGPAVLEASNGYAAIFFRSTGSTHGTSTTGTWSVGKLNGTNGFGILKNGMTGGGAVRADAALSISNDGDITTGKSLGIGGSPDVDLHIKSAAPTIRFTDTDTNRFSQIYAVDGNLRFDADNSNAQADTNISFRTDNTERLRIDDHGVLRVGNTHDQYTSGNTKRIALGAKASIWGWASGQINGALTLSDNYYWDGSNNKAIESDYCAYLSLRSGSMRFGCTAASQTGGQNVSGGIHEKVRFENDGNVSIADGNLSFASGHGINFSANTDGGGTSTATLLEDYEEGSYTITSNTNLTLDNNRTGYYTKVGNMVTVTGYLSLNTNDGSPSVSGSNNILLSLPYAANTSTGTYTGTMLQQNIDSNTGTSYGHPLYYKSLPVDYVCLAGSDGLRFYINYMELAYTRMNNTHLHVGYPGYTYIAYSITYRTN